MPGYRFRRVPNRLDNSTTDYWHCSNGDVTDGPVPAGVPAECSRYALAQVEFRTDLNINLFGVLDEDRDWRRRGWGRGPQVVVFADAGRGWLVGASDNRRTFSPSQLPSLYTFQTDIGIGLVLDDLGVYVAKAVSQGELPMKFFIRLRPRF